MAGPALPAAAASHHYGVITLVYDLAAPGAVRANSTVRTATTSQASTSRTYSPTATSRSAVSWVRTARAIVPVTQVPTGNVKLHQVSANGSRPPAVRAVCRVSTAASTSHSMANPHTGTP